MEWGMAFGTIEARKLLQCGTYVLSRSNRYKLSGAMYTELDMGIAEVVSALQARGMWNDTLCGSPPPPHTCTPIVPRCTVFLVTILGHTTRFTRELQRYCLLASTTTMVSLFVPQPLTVPQLARHSYLLVRQRYCLCFVALPVALPVCLYANLAI